MDCIFCKLKDTNSVLFETNLFYGVWDTDPIQNGHLLIISKAHITNINQLSNDSLLEMITLQKNVVELFEKDLNVYGVTVLYNNGKVMMDNTHFHFHIVPRYKDDKFYDHIQVVKKDFDLMSMTHRINELFNQKGN